MEFKPATTLYSHEEEVTVRNRTSATRTATNQNTGTRHATAFAHSGHGRSLREKPQAEKCPLNRVANAMAGNPLCRRRRYHAYIGRWRAPSYEHARNRRRKVKSTAKKMRTEARGNERCRQDTRTVWIRLVRCAIFAVTSSTTVYSAVCRDGRRCHSGMLLQNHDTLRKRYNRRGRRVSEDNKRGGGRTQVRARR